ncbi:MAG: WecB/TagA/CpsF family glycosyltransferase [Muribaculaceae bacterium]|nr:WecB/TagA/CpsF family glycosyltransferase [Muribaculaceae bacterium]
MDKNVQLLNIPVRRITAEKLLEQLDSGVLVTPNIDHLVKLQKDGDFYAAYSDAEWVVCDSRILLLCSKLLHKSLPEAIPGSSFFPRFYRYHAADPDCRIFLLGAAPGVGEKAMQRINESVGRKMVIGSYSPPYGFEKNPEECDRIVDIINATDATVVLVGLGAPKQEKWIHRYRSRMPGVKLWMALGATIDFEAGNIARAPRWVQTICMEWFYRFLKEPRRMFRRYFVDDPVFFYYFLQQLTGRYRSPFQ